MEVAGCNVACSKGTSSSCNVVACRKRRRCNRFACYRRLLAVLVAAWILPSGIASNLATEIADASTTTNVEANTVIFTTDDNYVATTVLPTSFRPQIAEPGATVANETVHELDLVNTSTIATTPSTTPKPDVNAELVGNEIFAVPEDLSVIKEVKQSPDFIESQHDKTEAGSTKDLEQTIRNSVKTEIEMEQNLDGILDVLKDIPESDVRQTLTDEILSVEYPQKSEEEPQKEETPRNLTTLEMQLTTKPSIEHHAQSSLREARNLDTASVTNALEADEVGDIEMQNIDEKIVGFVSEDNNNKDETHPIVHESHETNKQKPTRMLDDIANDQDLAGQPKLESEEILEKENIIEDSYSEPAKVKGDEAYLQEHEIEPNLIAKEISTDFKDNKIYLEKQPKENLENLIKSEESKGHEETTNDGLHENLPLAQLEAENEVDSFETKEPSQLATTSTEQPSVPEPATHLSLEVNSAPTELSIVLEESLTPTEPAIELQDLVDEPDETSLSSDVQTTPASEIVHHFVIKKEGVFLNADLDNDIADAETTMIPALADAFEQQIKDDSAELPLEVELPINDLNDTQETATENTLSADEHDSTALPQETSTELIEPTTELPPTAEVVISPSTESIPNKGSRSIATNGEEKAVPSTFLEALPSRIAGQAFEDNLTAESGEQVGKPLSASSMMDFTTNRSFVIIVLSSSTALLFIVILVTIFLATFRSQQGTLDIEMQEQRCGKDIMDEVELDANIGTATKLLEIELPNKNNSIEIAEIDEVDETDECL